MILYYLSCTINYVLIKSFVITNELLRIQELKDSVGRNKSYYSKNAII